MSDQSRKFLSRRLPLGRGLVGWVIERPGKQLDADGQVKLLEDLRAVANSTLKGEPLDYGVFDSESNALDRSIITVIYDKRENRAVAFNAMPIIDLEIQNKPVEVIHLGLVMVDPGIRGGGLSSMLYGFACAMLLIRRKFRPIWISSVTQVPAVVGLVSEQYSDTFPSPGKTVRRTFTHLQLARQIIGEHRDVFGVGDDCVFDEETFIIANAYTGGSDNLKKTFEESAKHRKRIYNDMCETQLNYDRGDDFLQIGRLDMPGLRHYMLRVLPATSPVGALAALTFLGFQYVYLPVRYWFDSSKEWQGLRPWKD